GQETGQPGPASAQPALVLRAAQVLAVGTIDLKRAVTLAGAALDQTLEQVSGAGRIVGRSCQLSLLITNGAVLGLGLVEQGVRFEVRFVGDEAEVRAFPHPLGRFLGRPVFLPEAAGERVADVGLLTPRPDADVFLIPEDALDVIVVPTRSRRPVVLRRAALA